MLKRIAVVTALLGTAALASAQEPQRPGQLGIDAVGAPELGVRFPIQLSSQVSLRPGLGFGSSELTANFWNLGADIRYTFKPEESLSAFVSAYAGYLHNQDGSFAGTSSSLQGSSNGALVGAGLGLRKSFSRKASIFGELRLNRTTAANAYNPWASWSLNDQTSLSLGFGATFYP
jgi:hypothetical protein